MTVSNDDSNAFTTNYAADSLLGSGHGPSRHRTPLFVGQLFSMAVPKTSGVTRWGHRCRFPITDKNFLKLQNKEKKQPLAHRNDAITVH